MTTKSRVNRSRVIYTARDVNVYVVSAIIPLPQNEMKYRRTTSMMKPILMQVGMSQNVRSHNLTITTRV